MAKPKKETNMSVNIEDLKEMYNTVEKEPKLEQISDEDLADTKLATKNVSGVVCAVVSALSEDKELHTAIAKLTKSMTDAFIKQGYTEPQAITMTIEVVRTLQPIFKLH